MQRIVECLVAHVGVVVAENIVGFGFVGRAILGFVGGLWEQIVGDAHFHVIGFAGENHDRLVLSFPAEASDGAVIAAAVGHTRNSERLSKGGGGLVARQNFAVLNAIQDSEPEELQGNPET